MGRGKSRWAVIAVFCASVCLAGRAQAQPRASAGGEQGEPDGVPDDYVRAAKLALQEYELGNYEEARSRFLEAHRLFPNARSLRSLGKVEYDLKNYLASIDYLERSLTSQVRPLDEALRTDVQELLEKARGYVATYTVELQPKQAMVAVDGQPAELNEGQRVTLEVGAHELTVHADGYQSVRLPIEVAGRRDEVLKVQLTPLAAEPVEEEGGGWGAKQWGLLGAAVVVVAGGVAAGVVLSTRDDGSAAEPTGGSSGATIFF